MSVGTVTAGTEYYEDFLIDNVLAFANGTEYDFVEELHYHIYIPEGYDGSRPYALYITLPGYGAYYFQGAAVIPEVVRLYPLLFQRDRSSIPRRFW